MLRKLRIRFVVINMTIVVLMLCLIFAFLFISTRHSLEQESLRMMQNIAAEPIMRKRPDDRPIDDIRLPFFYVEIDPDGKLITKSDGYFDLSDERYLQELIGEASARRELFGVIGDQDLRFLKSPNAMGSVLVFSDITSERATLSNLIRSCLMVGIAAFMIFLIISILLAHWAVKPIGVAWQQQKQFVADASHELKTPLTVIMTNASLLKDCNEEERIRFSSGILTMAEQMRGLVESMLELTRFDTGKRKQELIPLTLSSVISNAVLPFEPVFYEKQLILSCDIENDIRITGSAEHMKQLVDILLDNAQKYASPGGETHVILKKRNHKALLTVENQGAALSAEECKAIFKRFYRGDSVRTMNHSYGLGLSIAEGIATEHHGRIWAESSDGYNRFHIELPAL